MRRGFGAEGYPHQAVSPGYPVNEADELNMLKSRASDLKGSLEEINRRISDLEKRSG